MKILTLTTNIRKNLVMEVDQCEIWWGKNSKETIQNSSAVMEYLKTLTLVLFDGSDHEYHEDNNVSNLQDQNDMSALLKDVEKMVESSMFSR